MNLDLVIAKAAPPPERLLSNSFSFIPADGDSLERRLSALSAAFGSRKHLHEHSEALGLSFDAWLRSFGDVRLSGPDPDWAVAFRCIYERLNDGLYPFAEIRRFAVSQVLDGCSPALRLADDVFEGPLDYLASRFSSVLQPIFQFEKRLGLRLEWEKRIGMYPALAHAMGRVTADWIADLARLLSLATADRGEIARNFFGCDDPGVLHRIECGLGDPHMGGRSVAILHFERGSVVFKPKDIRIADAVGRIARNIEDASLAAPSLLLRDGYAWEKRYEVGPIAHAREADSFYRSLGGWLSLLQTLGAIDFWFDNLIAEGHVARFVDFETAVQPPHEFPNGFRPLVGDGDVLVRYSPFGVGILPLLFPVRPGVDPSDISCLARPGKHRTPLLGRDGEDFLSWEETCFAPRYENGAYADSSDHFEAFEEGYLRVAHELGRPNAQRRILDILESVSEARIRIIPIDTWTCYRAIGRSLAPRFLSNAVWREIELHALVPHQKEFIGPTREAAVRDLRRIDIPFFQGCLRSRDLLGSGNERLEGIYDLSPIDAVQERIVRLAGVSDDDRLAWIRSGFGMRLNNRPRRAAASRFDTPAESFDFLAWADEIATRIVDLTVRNDPGFPTWISHAHDVFTGWQVIGPMGFDILSGRAGVALVLLQLAELLERPELFALACETLEGVAVDCGNDKKLFLASGAGYGVGAGGLIVALASVPDLVSVARELFGIASSNRVWMQSGSDTISGLAGWSLAARALNEKPPELHGKDRIYAPSALARLSCWIDGRQATIPCLTEDRAAALRLDFDTHGTWFAESWLDDRHNLSGTDGLPALALRLALLAAPRSHRYRIGGGVWPLAIPDALLRPRGKGEGDRTATGTA